MKEILLETELMSFPKVAEANPDIFLQNDRNVRIIVEVFRNCSEYDLTGTADVLFLKPNGTTVTLTDGITMSRNRVTFSVPDSCFDQIGEIQLTIRNHSDGGTTTLGVVRGHVYSSSI